MALKGRNDQDEAGMAMLLKGRQEIKKGQKTEDKHAESWGQVGWALRWRHTTAAFTSFLFFPIPLLLFKFLYKI
jgi:hypothetical protein